MKKYTQSLGEQLNNQGYYSRIWYPTVFFGYGQKSTNSGIGKWLGYLDKWVLFPMILRIRHFNTKYRRADTYYHVCDHSNSPYLGVLPKKRTGITCHDVLAIRGALGYEDAYCPASPMGKILQKWILSNLKAANIITCVSQLTLNQLLILCEKEAGSMKNWRVVPNFFNACFWPMQTEEKKKILSKLNMPTPFLLHVGSALARKNRKMLVDMLAQLGDRWKGVVCFAGQPLDEKLAKYAMEIGVMDKIFSIVRPDHNELVALYSSCEAFVFPSYSEGFGWPLIEAQACGALVIASNIEPMPEVAGKGAFFANPDSPAEFANAYLRTLGKNTRNQIIEKGFENCQRFDSARIIRLFVESYTTEIEK